MFLLHCIRLFYDVDVVIESSNPGQYFYYNCIELFLDGDRVIIDNNMTSVFIEIVKGYF